MNSREYKDLGNAQKAAGDLAGAAQNYRRALELTPDFTDALYNLGLVLRELGQAEEAERCFRRAIAIEPRDGDALAQLSTLLHDAMRLDEAAQEYRRALEITPDNAYLLLRLGSLCAQTGKPDEAARCLREALKRDPALAAAPEFAIARNDLGCSLLALERLDEAAASFASAVESQPGYANAHFNLGVAHGMRGEHEQALACAETALRLQPGDPTFAAKALIEVQQLCAWPRLDELSALMRRNAQGTEQRPVNPFCLLSIPSTPAEQLACAAKFSDMHERAASNDPRRSVFAFKRAPRERLRIGYLSADFHEHATAYLAAELFELHDRKRFEVIGYSYGRDDGSAMRARLRRAFDRFVDIMPLSNAGAASAIHADGIDILVDLKGYTQHARTEILALRPSPIQVNYLGYPGTMGAGFIDYLVGDRFLTPAEHAGAYREKLVRMPGSYQVNDRNRPMGATPSRAALGLPEAAFVFCCFNQTFKILPDIFSAWMRLLHAVPDSVIWLLESNPAAVRNLKAEAAARGIELRRLVFAPRLPLESHLGRMAAADLFLDTLPYNAHTTASDALWAGLPVLTCAGETFASRVAGSLLNAIGLPELVTESMEQYERLALQLARDAEYLRSLRNRLGQNRATALLFDSKRFARDLESAYLRMYSTFLSGANPSPIEL